MCDVIALCILVNISSKHYRPRLLDERKVNRRSIETISGSFGGSFCASENVFPSISFSVCMCVCLPPLLRQIAVNGVERSELYYIELRGRAKWQNAVAAMGF